MHVLRKALIVILIVICNHAIFADDEPAHELDMNDLRRRILNEDPREFMRYSLGDSDVVLFLTGSWKGELLGNLGFFASPVGTGFISPDTPLLFKQEVDLTMALWINDRWFVEASFLDDSSQNAYRAGYRGKPGEFVQYAGIGNTGLDFPSFPYMDLGGDSPASFGFYGRFGLDKLNIHALLRYDAASREERVFTGSRERTYTDISPAGAIHGISFVLPDTNIESDITVYIEDERGEITESNGRRWRIAPSGEYAFSREHGLLEMSIRPSGMIAVHYAGNKIGLGSYSGSGFLRDVQDWFDSGNVNVDLADYPQCYETDSQNPWDFTIAGNSVLIIFQPGTFSPFERRNVYDAPSSSTERASLIRLSTGREIEGFELVEIDASLFADNVLSLTQTRGRALFELAKIGNGASRRDPQSRWPLAGEAFEIYVPSGSVFSGDIALRFANFNSASGYFIGTDAIPGSIQVWRSGIQDSNFNYNLSSGEVSIQSPAGQNETIRITYLKKTDGLRFGSIAAGLGAVYQNSAEYFTAQAALGVRWNLTDDSFSQEDSRSAGTVGLGAKAAWKFENFNAHLSAGFSAVEADTTGLYRAAGMEGYETTLPLPHETSFISHPFNLADGMRLNAANRVDLVYRNYFNNNVLGSNLMTIEWNAPVVSGINRPYPVRDSQLGNAQALTAEISLSDGEWSGYQVPLGLNAEILSRASEIEIPFRLYDALPPGNFRIIVQIGSLGTGDFEISENSNLIWEKSLLPNETDANAFYFASGDYTVARFKINDEERRRLADAKYLRIAAVYNGTGSIFMRVILAPPVVRSSIFRAVAKENNEINPVTNLVTASETREIGANNLESAYPSIVNRLHPFENTQRVLEIRWQNMPPGASAGVDGRIREVPLGDYRELSFFARVPNTSNENAILSFIVLTGDASLSNPQLEAKIPIRAFTHNNPNMWKKVTVRYQGENASVFVDGFNEDIAPPVYRRVRANPDNERRTSYIAIFIDPLNQAQSLDAGSVFIDEIILEDPVMLYRANAGAFVNYSKPGVILSLGNISVLENFSISSAFESEANAQSGAQFSGSAISRTGAQVTLIGINVSGNLGFTAADDAFLWNADHEISKTMGAFYARETFFASPGTEEARHSFNIGFASDFHAKFDADALYELGRLRQRWNASTGFIPKNEHIPSFLVSGEALWTKQNRIEENENYGELWLRTFAPLVPDSGTGTDARRTISQVVITQRTKPVGAVLAFQGMTNFTGANNLTLSEYSLFLDVPVVFERTGVNFRAGRFFKKNVFFSGYDVTDDADKFFELVTDSFALWKVFPFYSLFSPDLETAMDEAIMNSPSANISQYTSFNDHFSVRINLPSMYNLASFFVPSRINFRIERILEQKLDTRADNLNIAGSLGFSSINMFGAMGNTPIFAFYQTDEFSHGIEAAVIIPKDATPVWRVQSSLNAGFRGFTGGVLGFANTFTIRTDGYWLESFVAGWEAPTKKSLLSVFYNWVSSLIDENQNWNGFTLFFNSSYEQLRKETLEIIFDKTQDDLRWSIILGHEETIRILGRMNFTTFIKLRYNENQYTDLIVFDIQLGTSLRISF
ncbi:MAG: hypothetical protein FWC01_00145 [Treponema sp.]|nr:hypothetical protein [Treponema sp.]MCL2236670.1 hypothetical protein [Treponema sp.]